MSGTFANIQKIYECNPELKNEDIRNLKSWLEGQKHLPKIDELQLLLFFHSCYFDIEASKRCIENYYTTRSKIPALFENRNVFSTELQSQLKVALQTPLPRTTTEDYMVFYIRLMDTNPSNYIYSSQIKMLDMAIQLSLMQFGPKMGFVSIFDMQGTSFGHLFRINPITSKRFVNYVQEALPVRLKGIHLINVNVFTAQFIQLLRPFMRKQLADLLHVHRTLDSLYQEIPQEILPKELGGDAGTILGLHQIQVQNLENHADFFVEDERLKADESKRIR